MSQSSVGGRWLCLDDIEIICSRNGIKPQQKSENYTGDLTGDSDT